MILSKPFSVLWWWADPNFSSSAFMFSPAFSLHAAQLASDMRDPRYPAPGTTELTVSLAPEWYNFHLSFQRNNLKFNFITLRNSRNVQNLNLYACQYLNYILIQLIHGKESSLILIWWNGNSEIWGTNIQFFDLFYISCFGLHCPFILIFLLNITCKTHFHLVFLFK